VKLKIEHILILALGIIIIYLSTCTSNPVIEKPVEVIRTDSIYVHTTDTITNIIHVPFKTIEYIDSTTIDTTLNGYSYGGNDSLLSYSIWVESKERPKNVKLEYDLKNFTIHDTISTYVRDSVYELDNKSYFSIGANIGGSKDAFSFSPTLMYHRKRNYTATIGYDVINNMYIVGFSKKLSFRK
jgi:hypothetical protein